jgi:hypothetical protein
VKYDTTATPSPSPAIGEGDEEDVDDEGRGRREAQLQWRSLASRGSRGGRRCGIGRGAKIVVSARGEVGYFFGGGVRPPGRPHHNITERAQRS